MLGLYNLIITWLSLIDRPCVGVKEEPAEEESWYCSKCMGRSKKPAKRGRGRGRGRGPGRGKKKMMWTPVSQTEASARKEKIIVWNFVSENRGKMEKEKCCELSTQRTRLKKGKKQIYVNYCVRERGSARGRETNIMWTLVLGNRAHEGKVGNDVFVSGKKAHGSCVRLYALSRTMRQDHDSIGPLEPLLWQWRCLLMQSFVYFLCFEKFWHHFCSSAWYTFLLIIVAVGV